MIGGKRQNHRFAILHHCKGRARRKGRPGIASHRLQQDIGFNADLGQLLENHEAIGNVGDDDRLCE